MSYIVNETEHKHEKSNVIDSVVLFEVDPVTRVITKTSENDIILVKNDHNSERYRIAMPRYIDGHDMSLCDIARVHYINTGSSGFESPGIYEADDLSLIINEGETAEDASKISFTWLVANIATKEYGRLAFAIELACSSDVAENGYSWHSGVYSNITVSDGIHNSNKINTVYGDILQSWWEKLFIEKGGVVDENSRQKFRFWLGTQEEYNALKTEDIVADCLYFISDDKTFENLEKKVNDSYNHSVIESGNPHKVTAADVGAYSTAETDNKITAVKSSTETYADTKASTAESNAKEYADDKVGAALSEAKTYASTQASTAESNAKSYADGKAATAEENAGSYTENRLGDIPSDSNVKEYVDDAVSNNNSKISTAESNAKSYAEKYVNTAVSSALNTAKSYTDEAVAKSDCAEELSIHINNKNNPHNVTADQIKGLASEISESVSINYPLAASMYPHNDRLYATYEDTEVIIPIKKLCLDTKASALPLAGRSVQYDYASTVADAYRLMDGLYARSIYSDTMDKTYELQIGGEFIKFNLSGYDWAGGGIDKRLSMIIATDFRGSLTLRIKVDAGGTGAGLYLIAHEAIGEGYDYNNVSLGDSIVRLWEVYE